MKILLAEALKKVKMLDKELADLLATESRQCQITYRTQEEKILPDYDFDVTRKNYAEIANEIIKIKKAINAINNDTLIGVGDLTVADGLVKMALINKEIELYLSGMSAREKLTSRVDIRNDGIFYTEQLYDIQKCKNYIKEQKELLSQIQMGIDRINLTTYIEY